MSRISALKRLAVLTGESAADAVFALLLHPAWFARSSRQRIDGIRVGSWFYYDYVFNQKAQRLQLLARMRAQGNGKPTRFRAWWPRGRSNNFGDILTHYILSHAAHLDCIFDKSEPFSAVGSTIRLALDHTRVWGSGIIRTNEVMPSAPACLAVRGPLTRGRILAAGLDCPEVYGDPAMLLPLLYTPSPLKKLPGVSLAPHFTQAFLRNLPDAAHYLDVEARSIADIEAIIDRIAASETVVTSSLHVFIMCVAYGVPVTVFQISGRTIHGDNVKFKDFCLGVNLEPVTLHQVPAMDQPTLQSLGERAAVYRASWDPLPLLRSLQSFINTPRLSDIIEQMERGRTNGQQR